MFCEERSYIVACEKCTMGRKPSINTTSGHLIASRPLEVLAIDSTKLDQASDGRENVLVMTDIDSKFTQAVPTRNREATTVLKILVCESFQRYGVPPKRIRSDQGRRIETKRDTPCVTQSTTNGHIRAKQNVFLPQVKF